METECLLTCPEKPATGLLSETVVF